MEMDNLRERLEDLENQLYNWIPQKNEAVNELRAIANNLDEHFQRIGKAKIGGSTAGIVGGVMAAFGFGLSFVTFGASLGLTVAGGVIAGSGGAVVGGSVAADAVLSRKRKNSAQEILQRYNSMVDRINRACVEIGGILERIAAERRHPKTVDEAFPHWTKFWFKLTVGTTSAATGAGWNVISKTLLTSLSITTPVNDVVAVGAKTGTAAFTTMGAAVHIAGGVVGILLIPLDIYTLVDSSINIRHKNPHEMAETIRELANKIDQECPTEDEIERMIEETSNRL